jgi:hypothetical protein
MYPMPEMLPYYTPEDRRWRDRHGELSRAQAEMNAGARRIYAARRRQVDRFAPRHPGVRALPATFAPRPLALLPAPPGWDA